MRWTYLMEGNEYREMMAGLGQVRLYPVQNGHKGLRSGESYKS